MPTIQIPYPLLKETSQRQVVLFAGAGISMPALKVSANTIRDALGAEIWKAYPDYNIASRSVEDVCDEYAVLFGKMSLVAELANLIPQNIAPLPSHQAAARTFRFIVTTNWDTLFEKAIDQISQAKNVLSSEQHAMAINMDQHNLLKIHGSVDQPTTLIATTEDYERYPLTHKALLKCWADLLWNNTVLFVGYSFRDEHVRHILARIREERGEFQRRAYAVMGPSFADTVRTKLLDRRGIEVLPYAAEDFLPELAQQAGV